MQRANSIMGKVYYSPVTHLVPTFLSTAEDSREQIGSENDFHPHVNG